MSSVIVVTRPRNYAATRRLSTNLLVLLIVGASACSSEESASTPSASGGTGGLGGSAGSGVAVAGAGGAAGAGATSGLGGMGNAGAGGNACAVMNCDDGISCTLDTCKGGLCLHTLGPNAGKTSCPSGQYCTVEKGCVSAPACASDAQCKDLWKNEPCKGNVRCDSASSVCLFDVLDKDGDKHPPPVCGGDDCDDGDAKQHPGNAEACDGKDNNCNGEIDEKAKCMVMGILGMEEDKKRACVKGTCVCLPEFQCGQSCTDKQDDPQNCGACGHVCVGGLCKKGVCSCGSGKTMCGDTCTDVTSDKYYCGSCTNDCTSISGGPFDVSCIASQCRCGSGTSLLCGDGTCKDPSDPESCGACDLKCPSGIACIEEKCNCPPAIPTLCNAYAGNPIKICTDTMTDHHNCGGCEHECATNESCSNGTCVCPLTCNGVCVAPFDSDNCGACGKKCDAGQICSQGVCGGGSGAGGMGCPSCGCQDFFNDPLNCGGCGIACDPAKNEICKEGTCL
jgi:hypothetical protein